ncbi:MAG: transglutaminase domain-containing protein [Gemmataceae bacterium]
MLRWFAFLMILVPTVAQANSPPPEGVMYETVFFEGKRIGFHTVRVVREAKDKFTRVTSTLDLTLSRFGTLVQIRREEGARLTADGTLFGTFMHQGQDGGKGTSLIGTVIDNSLLVRVLPLDAERRVPWEPTALDPWTTLHQFMGKKLQPGDSFTFCRWEPLYNRVITVRVTVRNKERTAVGDKIRELRRLELVPDALVAGPQRVVPARQTWWLDDEGIPQRRQTTLDGLGQLTLLRSDKATATASITSGVPDVGKASFAPLNKPLHLPYQQTKLRYRVTVREQTELTGLFVSDDHQTARVVDGAIELTVAPPRCGSGSAKAAPEELAPNYYLDHEEQQVMQLARRAAGEEKDAWKKAQRIERFVRTFLRNDNRAELVPVSKIVRDPRGDCRHHAFLTTALLRANGLPARTAIGLLYVYRGSPVFGFHMWSEVLIDGQWRGLDSTLLQGGVSAAHIKITDHHWAKVDSLAPMLPAQQIVGKVRFELLAND